MSSRPAKSPMSGSAKKKSPSSAASPSAAAPLNPPLSTRQKPAKSPSAATGTVPKGSRSTSATKLSLKPLQPSPPPAAPNVIYPGEIDILTQPLTAWNASRAAKESTSLPSKGLFTDLDCSDLLLPASISSSVTAHRRLADLYPALSDTAAGKAVSIVSGPPYSCVVPGSTEFSRRLSECLNVLLCLAAHQPVFNLFQNSANTTGQTNFQSPSASKDRSDSSFPHSVLGEFPSSDHSCLPFLDFHLHPCDGKSGIAKFHDKAKYSVRVFYDMEWRILSIDDQMPVDSSNNCVFPVAESRGRCKELWPWLISKAIFKVFPGMEIDANGIRQIITLFTGLNALEMDSLVAKQFPYDPRPLTPPPIKVQTNEEKDNNKTQESESDQQLTEWTRSISARFGDYGWYHLLKSRDSGFLFGLAQESSNTDQEQPLAARFPQYKLSTLIPTELFPPPPVNYTQLEFDALAGSAAAREEKEETKENPNTTKEEKKEEETNESIANSAAAASALPRPVYLVLPFDLSLEKQKVLQDGEAPSWVSGSQRPNTANSKAGENGKGKAAKVSKEKESGKEKEKERDSVSGSSSSPKETAKKTVNKKGTNQNAAAAVTLDPAVAALQALLEAEKSSAASDLARYHSTQSASSSLLRWLRGCDLDVPSEFDRDRSRVKLVNLSCPADSLVLPIQLFVELFPSLQLVLDKSRFAHHALVQDIWKEKEWKKPFSCQGHAWLFMPKVASAPTEQSKTTQSEDANKLMSPSGSSKSPANGAKGRKSAAASRSESGDVSALVAPTKVPTKPIARRVYLHLDCTAQRYPAAPASPAPSALAASVPYEIIVEEFDWLSGQAKTVLERCGSAKSATFELDLPAPREYGGPDHPAIIKNAVHSAASNQRDSNSRGGKPRKPRDTESFDRSALTLGHGLTGAAAAPSPSNPLGSLYRVTVRCPFGYSLHAFSHSEFLFEHSLYSASHSIMELMGVSARLSEFSYAPQFAKQRFLLFHASFQVPQISASAPPSAPQSPMGQENSESAGDEDHSASRSGSAKAPRAKSATKRPKEAKDKSGVDAPAAPLALAVTLTGSDGSESQIQSLSAPAHFVQPVLTANGEVTNLSPSSAVIRFGSYVLDSSLSSGVQLELINRDTLDSQLFNSHETPSIQLAPNRSGYSILCHCVAFNEFDGRGVPAGRVFCSVDSSVPLDSLTFESLGQLSCFTEEFKYNSQLIVFRGLVQGASNSLTPASLAVDFHPSFSSSQIQSMVTSPELGLSLRLYSFESYSDALASGSAAAPLAIVRNLDSALLPVLLVSKDTKLVVELAIDSASLSRFLARTAAANSLPVGSLEFSQLSGRASIRLWTAINGAVSLAIDRSAEEEFAQAKINWEKAEPGRAKKAKAAREAFLAKSAANGGQPQYSALQEVEANGGVPRMVNLGDRDPDRVQAEAIAARHRIAMQKYHEFVHYQLQKDIVEPNAASVLQQREGALAWNAELINERSGLRGKLQQQESLIMEARFVLSNQPHQLTAFLDELHSREASAAKAKKDSAKEVSTLSFIPAFNAQIADREKYAALTYLECLGAVLAAVEPLPDWKRRDLIDESRGRAAEVSIEALQSLSQQLSEIVNPQPIISPSLPQNAKTGRGSHSSTAEPAPAQQNQSARKSSLAAPGSKSSGSGEAQLQPTAALLVSMIAQSKKLAEEFHLSQESDAAVSEAVAGAETLLFNVALEQVDKLSSAPKSSAPLPSPAKPGKPPLSSKHANGAAGDKDKSAASDFVALEYFYSLLNSLSHRQGDSADRLASVLERADRVLSDWRASESAAVDAAESAIAQKKAAAAAKKKDTTKPAAK